MSASIQYVLEQAKSLLFSLLVFIRINIWAIPVLLMVVNFFSYGVLYKVTWDFFVKEIDIQDAHFPQWYQYWEANVRHFFECSGLFILLLWCYYKSFNWWSYVAQISLTLLFIANTIYIAFSMPVDIYYCCTVCIIYTTFVFIVVGKVLIRC